MTWIHSGVPDPEQKEADTPPAAGLAALIGDKAATLGRLRAEGFPVPPFYVVTAAAFHDALAAHEEGDGVRERLRTLGTAVDPEQARDAAAALEAWIGALVFPPPLVAAVRRAHAQHFAPGTLVAVRSSVAGEDAAAHSFAGVHESVLSVLQLEQLLAALRKVWASAFGERALTYRRLRNLPLGPAGVAVIVQQLVDARASGVVFTVDPVSGDRGRLVAHALYGLGPGLVSVGLPVDQFVVERRSLAVSAEIAPKPTRLRPDPEGGGTLRVDAVPDALRDAPSLGEETVRSLARTALALERRLGRPQDIEFCVDPDGRVVLLQARPVTASAAPDPEAPAAIWDNSNIIESYPGVTSPMTFSIVRRAYAIVYRSVAEVMGVPSRVLERHQTVFDTMLGLFRGRVYYNLGSWHRALRLLPGYRFNQPFMAAMMGVKEGVALDDPAPAPGPLRRYAVELPALAWLLARSAWNVLRVRAWVRGFERRFEARYRHWRDVDFDGLPAPRLLELYDRLEADFLRGWKAPIVNDIHVMIFHGTLKGLCRAWCADGSGSLANALLAGNGDIESTKPTEMLLGLAGIARASPELREYLLAVPPAVAARELPTDRRFADFAGQIARFLQLYGFRGPGELKLEEPSLRERPEFVYQVIRNYLGVADPATLDRERIERDLRTEAERRAAAAVAGLRAAAPRRLLFRWVLGRARLGIRYRENLRFARARTYGLARELLRALGQELGRHGIVDRSEDVFYLTLDEVRDYVRGTAVTTRLAELAALRREEFAAYRREAEHAPPARFETRGFPYRGIPRATPPAPAGDTLRGTGACPGQAIGPVKVAAGRAGDFHLSGEILVAEWTDPGWIPLYPSISGLLVERGSLLSHSAIVAREMAVPTIVGIRGLLHSVRPGQWVSMDGAAGTVRLLREAPAAAPRGSSPPDSAEEG